MTIENMQVWSEIGNLKKVLLHRPGSELNNLIPRYLEDLLFDEIPWLAKAQKEHDDFARVLKENGTEVFYISDLLTDIIQAEDLKEEIINKQLTFTPLIDPDIITAVYEYLLSLAPQELVFKLMAGLHKKEVQMLKKHRTLSDLTLNSYPFYLAPLPNLYFTRDHGTMIGNRLQVSSMFNFARRRETLFLRFIQKYHPLFQETPLAYTEELPHGIEGGDVFVLNKDTLIIGLSERTTEEAVEWIAAKYLVKDEVVKQVIVVQIPAKRAYMHLDTVFTMVDYDKFLMYPGIKNEVNVYWLEKGSDGRVSATNGYNLKGALQKGLGIKHIDIIYSGGDDSITAAREQWGDSTNTLAIQPGKVICYDRNEATNRILENHGIDVVVFDGSELVRGRGGPRCMSMPLDRAPF